MSHVDPSMHQPKTFLQVVLIFFIGLLIASFVGFGIAAFYPEPKMPEYPVATPAIYPASPGEDMKLPDETDYRTRQDAYTKDLARYNKTVAAIAVLAALIVLALALTVAQRIQLMGDATLLGGLFTLAYAISRGIASEDPRVSFLMIAIGLVVAVWLTYWRYGRAAVTS